MWTPRPVPHPLPRRKSFPEKRRPVRGWGQPACPPPRPPVPQPTVRRRGAVPVPVPDPGSSLPEAPEGRSPARCWARLGGSQSSLRPFIPASPKRIRFDVQPGFLWVWSEPVQPSLGDTPLSKSYIFYITSFPAWLFFLLPPLAGEHPPPPHRSFPPPPPQLKNRETHTPPAPTCCREAPQPTSLSQLPCPVPLHRQRPPCPWKSAAPHLPAPSRVVL